MSPRDEFGDPVNPMDALTDAEIAEGVERDEQWWREYRAASERAGRAAVMS